MLNIIIKFEWKYKEKMQEIMKTKFHNLLYFYMGG